MKALTTALAALLALSPAAQATNVDAGHIALGRAIIATGVDLKINPQECDDTIAFGWYWAAKNELVICQENATAANVEVPWTAEDFDTLRHEAHHLIQDCLDGSLQGEIETVYVDSQGFVASQLSPEQVQSIASSYEEQGPETVITELEAFAVAHYNEPGEQVADINRYCLGN